MQDFPYLTTKEVQHVYNCSYGTGWGTCFLWGDSAGTFFVTAKHVVENLNVGDRIKFRHPSDKLFLSITGVAHSATHDLSIFTSDTYSFPNSWQYPDGSAALGQRTLFLGYPHGLSNGYPSHHGLPSPLVRNAFFSGVVDINRAPTVILDGFNNPGYSGGPVYIASEIAQQVSLFAVISGYRHEKIEHSKVYTTSGGSEAEIPGTYAKINSGMIYATGINYLNELIPQLKTRNPIPSD